MKRIISLFICIMLIAATGVCRAGAGAGALDGVRHMKQSTVRIERGGSVIYFDPFKIGEAANDADVVFVTHTHGDHFSISDIKKVLKEGGTLVIPAEGVEAAETARKEGIKEIRTVKPSGSYTAGKISFKTVPAYNIGKQFHPKEKKWVGYIVGLGGADYYFAGDTDLIPEMNKIKAEVAFLPVGGTYTMNAAEAAKAANLIKPQTAVPVHFSDVVGTTDDAVEFIKLLDKKINGAILKDLLEGVEHSVQSTIKISQGKTIYFDPLGIAGEPKDADMVFISHTHGDHFSIPDIKKVSKEGTVLVLPPDGVEAAVKAGMLNIVTAAPSKSYTIEGIRFDAVSAYNTNKDFHKKENKWVGYVVNLNNTSYYFAGDTDNIPEMSAIKANVVFLPVGGTYTMTASEAVQAANTIHPVIAAPIHFKDVVGTWEDAESFVKSLDNGIKGIILKK